MELPVFIPVSIAVFFGGLALMFFLKEKHLENQLEQTEDAQKQTLWETTILTDIESQLGYKLDAEIISDSISKNLENILTFSTVSVMLIKPEKIMYKVRVQESINQEFITVVKTKMLQSLTVLQPSGLPTEIEEIHLGSNVDEARPKTVHSFFHIPLLVNNEIAGLITIASSQNNFYTEEAMTPIYHLIDRSMQLLSRIDDVLTREKGKLMTIISNLADGVFMIDATSQLTVINDAAKECLNIRQENPTLTDILAALPPNHEWNQKIQSAMLQNQASVTEDVHMGEKLFNVSITPVLTTNPRFMASGLNNQKVIGASIVLHKVTLEKELAKMKEDFTSIIVHELRSPLTSIKASSDLLTSQTPLTEEEHKKLLTLIHEQSNKMLHEVSLILDSAKIEAGMFTIQKVPADLKEIIQEKIAIFQPLAQEKFVTISADIDPSLPKFSFDPHHIGQVISNLCSNSLKFTPSGGAIRVIVRQTLPSPTAPGMVSVSVSDTGSGIPKDKQHLLFSKFSQVPSKSSHRGTGLGLYFIKGVIDSHGGTIHLDSTEGHGTTITFTLPINLSAHTTFPPLSSTPKSKQLVN